MLRTIPERILQTVCFEVGGLIIAAPLFAYFTQTGQADSLIILIVISVAVMCWTGFHNYAFDWIEFRLTARIASDRPNAMRMVHATSHEVSSVIVSLPILIWLTDLSWQQALLAEVGLTVLYVLYALVFYKIYDVVRPVTTINLQGVKP